jgi:hypothetical protein
MATFVMLTRLGPGAIQAPADLKRLAQAVEDRIRRAPRIRSNHAAAPTRG